MAKQPYIPFYIGDYIRDTRMLPLNVRGAWVELILQSWDKDGELTATMEEYAMLISCTKEEAVLVIQTLNQKNIFGYTLLEDGRITIVVRKIKKMIELSKTRKTTGSLGGNPKLKKKLLKEKDNLIPEYEYEVRYNTLRDKVFSFKDKYDMDMLTKFLDYWTEKNDKGKKMRFELQDVFDLGRRLRTWHDNNKNRFQAPKETITARQTPKMI